MAYQAIPRDSPDWKPEVADQLNVVIDRIERLINNYPNVTREHYYDNTKFLPVSITGEGCSIRTNASLHYGQVYVINFTFWLAEGFRGQLGSIAMSSSPSPAWIAARSGSGFKVPLPASQEVSLLLRWDRHKIAFSPAPAAPATWHSDPHGSQRCSRDVSMQPVACFTASSTTYFMSSEGTVTNILIH